MLVRDVDKLDPMPDEKLRQLDEDYVVSIPARMFMRLCNAEAGTLAQQQETTCVGLGVYRSRSKDSTSLQIQHQLDKLLGGLMSDILKYKPQDPLQFIIDSITLGPEHAMQVCLPPHISGCFAYIAQ